LKNSDNWLQIRCGKNCNKNEKMYKLKILARNAVTLIVLIIIMSQSIVLHAQNKIITKDLDYENIQDNVYFDIENSILVCRLSSQNFAKIKSQPIEKK
jgi:hypothetical protein